MQTVIVYIIIAVAVALSIKSAIRKICGKNNGCSCKCQQANKCKQDCNCCDK